MLFYDTIRYKREAAAANAARRSRRPARAERLETRTPCALNVSEAVARKVPPRIERLDGWLSNIKVCLLSLLLLISWFGFKRQSISGLVEAQRWRRGGSHRGRRHERLH